MLSGYFEAILIMAATGWSILMNRVNFGRFRVLFFHLMVTNYRNIGIKDIFECFMMVLNYQSAINAHEARRAECFNTADR